MCIRASVFAIVYSIAIRIRTAIFGWACYIWAFIFLSATPSPSHDQDIHGQQRYRQSLGIRPDRRIPIIICIGWGHPLFARVPARLGQSSSLSATPSPSVSGHPFNALSPATSGHKSLGSATPSPSNPDSHWINALIPVYRDTNPDHRWCHLNVRILTISYLLLSVVGSSNRLWFGASLFEVMNKTNDSWNIIAVIFDSMKPTLWRLINVFLYQFYISGPTYRNLYMKESRFSSIDTAQ